MDIDTLLKETERQNPQSDLELLRRVYNLAAKAYEGQKEDSGLPHIEHSLATAMQLTELCLDPSAVAAAILHDVLMLTDISLESLTDQVGDEIAKLVGGVTRLNRIAWEKLDEENVENLQKMFLAMMDDVRVVIIKLAEQLDEMRNLDSLSRTSQKKAARETLYIFAPLSNKLGIWSLKRQLEDLSLKYLDSEKHEEIVNLLAERQEVREKEIAIIMMTLKAKLKEQGIEAEIFGRPKHIYSIYKKMLTTKRDFADIYDVQAVRIIVESIKDCYAALDVINGLWKPILEEFDDYIAHPKTNRYQSLHTAVLGPKQKPLEIQIRSREMHQIAEYGIASHWRYKEKVGFDTSIEAKISYLRILLEWQQELTESKGYFEPLKSPPFSKYVYALTPKGDIFDLLAGSTPLDFAYRVHTDIGHRCRGAKVNGKLTSLDYKLQNGDRVEIIKAKEKRPSRDWLNPRLGYVFTPRAKQKIRQWFRERDREENISRGREIFGRELKRLGIREKNYEEIALIFNFKKADDFFEAIGHRDISAHHIKTKLTKVYKESTKKLLPEQSAPSTEITQIVLVRGDKDFLTRTALCCRPLPGDEIIGFVTRGRGVTIHRSRCHNILRQRDKARLIEVGWGTGHQAYSINIRVEGMEAKNLLKEIAAIVEAEGARIVTSNLNTHKKESLAIINAMLEISSITQLNRILNKLKSLPRVTEAKRQPN